MLIPCPECERQVSDRARACPDCGFPVSEHVEGQREAQRRQAVVESRERVGEIDCPRCEARGFVNFTEVDEEGVSRQLFAWCVGCKHSGRVHQCRDLDGFHAVSFAALEAWLAGTFEPGEGEGEGEADPSASWVVSLGPEPVVEHRYSKSGKVWE
jgi:hypothetical protein